MYYFEATFVNYEEDTERTVTVTVDTIPLDASFYGGDPEELFAFKEALSQAYRQLEPNEGLIGIELVAC